jgi:hypothetical protein
MPNLRDSRQDTKVIRIDSLRPLRLCVKLFQFLQVIAHYGADWSSHKVRVSGLHSARIPLRMPIIRCSPAASRAELVEPTLQLGDLPGERIHVGRSRHVQPGEGGFDRIRRLA